jgi:hypothetical protein
VILITYPAFHSIAFKPAESGWGFGKKYHKNFDDIFGKKEEGTSKGEESAPATQQGKK